MKIAMMTNNYKPFIAGVPISIERLSRGLRQLGHEVTVFAPFYGKKQEEKETFRYASLWEGRGKIVPEGVAIPNCIDFRIEQEFKAGEFDLIHVHHPMLIGKTALYLSRKYNVPLVFTYHTRYEQYLHYGLPYPPLARRAARLMPHYVNAYTRHCDLVLAPTPLMKQYLQQIESQCTVEVLPTGLPESCYSDFTEEKKVIRQQFLSDRQYLFCVTARLAREKNLDFLIRSLARLKEEGMSFRMLIMGDGPEKSNLQKRIGELGLAEDIVFTGMLPNEEVPRYCAAADLFLFSSQSETQGIVLLEAMAAGAPVVAVKASGVVDVVRNGENGWMTEEKEEEFAAAVRNCLADQGLYESLCAGAKQTALQYSEVKIAAQAAELYQRVLWSRGSLGSRTAYTFSPIRSIIS